MNATQETLTPLEHFKLYDERIYRIIRFRFNGRPRTLKNNLSLAEAQEHCRQESTHGAGWFDGYDKMKGFL